EPCSSDRSVCEIWC
ncbi:zinc-regulated TonB-dependent outer membrane receptor domain protein, partial [Vibrio parahaemolyticus V-223/04]